MTKNTTITISPEDASFSGHELVIIPMDPKFLPNDDQIEAGLQFLKVHYPKHILESNKSTHVEFVDCGQHLETIHCNGCGQEMDTEFWQDQMSLSYENTHFEQLDFVTACCQKPTHLNALIYDGDCGFASYSLTINNAEPDDELESVIAKEMSTLLQTPIKLFWRHI